MIDTGVSDNRPRCTGRKYSALTTELLLLLMDKLVGWDSG